MIRLISFRVRRKSTTACAFLQCWFMRNGQRLQALDDQEGIERATATLRDRAAASTRALMA